MKNQVHSIFRYQPIYKMSATTMAELIERELVFLDRCREVLKYVFMVPSNEFGIYLSGYLSRKSRKMLRVKMVGELTKKQNVVS